MKIPLILPIVVFIAHEENIIGNGTEIDMRGQYRVFDMIEMRHKARQFIISGKPPYK